MIQFHSFEWVTQLPKSIVLGQITSDRKKDYTFSTYITADKLNISSTGLSEAFMTFIENELHSFIENTFQTKNLKQ